jgi:ligand-binding sensor domain-containing protein
VYAILKDKQGFMWFGTVDGLNKYNGYNFIHYKHDPYDSATLSHNHVNALHEDKSGNLWVGTLFGLNKFDRHTNTFIRYPHLLKNEKDGEISNLAVMSIHEDRWNTLWVGTNQGLLWLIPMIKTKFSSANLQTGFKFSPKV